MKRLLASASSLIALSACSTSLATRPVSLQQDRIDGVPYALPALQLETTVTHRLTKCTIILPGQDGYDPSMSTRINAPNLIVDFKTTVENKATYPASEYFVLDYSALASAFKTSNFKVTYHDNRMLKTFNVAAQDKSIEIGVEAVKAGVSIARLAAGVPVPAGAVGTAEALPFGCPTAKVLAGKPGTDGKPAYVEASLIDLRSGVAGRQKEAVEKLASINTKLAALTARSSNGTLSEADKTEITTLTNEGKELAKAISDLDKQIAEFDKTLAYKESFRWQPMSGAGGAGSIVRSYPFVRADTDDALRGNARWKWINGLFNQKKDTGFEDAFGELDAADCLPEAEACDPGAASRRIARILSLNFDLRPEHVVLTHSDANAIAARLGLSTRKPAKQSSLDHVRGIVTRQPVPGQFLICRGYSVPCTHDTDAKLLDESVVVPQLGAYVVLPYSNGFGEDNLLNAEFAESGVPTMIEYKENSAVALEAVKGISVGANSVNTFFQDLKAAREAEAESLANEPLKELERQAALLEQEKKIAELREQISPTDPLTLLQKKVSILEQEIRVAELLAINDPANLAHQETVDRLIKEVEVLRLQAQVLEQQNLVEGAD